MLVAATLFWSAFSLPGIVLFNDDSGAGLTVGLSVFQGSFKTDRFTGPTPEIRAGSSKGLSTGICYHSKHGVTDVQNVGDREQHELRLHISVKTAEKAPTEKRRTRRPKAQNSSLPDLKLKQFKERRPYLLFI